MYHITKDEALAMLNKLREIRQNAGEAISFLEHMFQLQSTERGVNQYNPDAYLERCMYRHQNSYVPSDKSNAENQN